MKKQIFIPILLFISLNTAFTQSLSVNMMNLNEYYQRQQLLGNLDPNLSFSIQPLHPKALKVEDIYKPRNSINGTGSLLNRKFSFAGNRGEVKLLPISLLSQFNSHHPEGLNDNAMISSKGFQTLLSSGVYFKYGPLEIKFKPEFVYAQNNHFNGFPSNYITKYGIHFPKDPYGNRIDLPERFGATVYKKVFWGQSSLRLNLGALSFGISNENLWWGVGYRNSLIMSNTAPGFFHLTLNTVQPINIGIGHIEGQIISGKLVESGYTESLLDDWRYINAMILSYNPKWINGLFLGFVRSFVMYHEGMGNSIGDYLPVFSFLSKNSGGTNLDVDNQNQNQIISIFMRWVFFKSNSEVYFEYGRDDHAWNTRDFVLEPSHSSTYIIGMRKLFPLNSKSTHIQLIIEATHLATNQTTINRNPPGNKIGSWYTHGRVKHGYTHMGQLIGAGIGPGSNLQTIDISWCQNLNQIGLRLERYVHNNDFWYDYVQDIRANWVDISYTAYANWGFKNFLVSFKLKHVLSRNYQWLYEPIYEGAPEFWAPTDNTINFHTQLGIIYRF